MKDEKPEKKPEKKQTIRVVTYNVHFGKNTDEIISLFQENKNLAKADIILFQEIEHHFAETMPRARALAEGLNFHFFYAPARPKKSLGTHGLATLSKFPILKNTSIELPRYLINFRYQQRIALASNILVNKKNITLANIHLDARLNADDRIIQLNFALDKLKLLFGENIILGGDLNTIPVYLLWKSIPILYQSQLKLIHNNLLSQSFVNFAGLRAHTMKRIGFKMRLDHIYTDNFRVIAWGVEHTATTSDHFPLWADIEI